MKSIKSTVETRRINLCRVCNSKDIQFIFSLGNQYLSDFVTTPSKGVQYPLDLMLCNDCGLLQLAETTPGEVLYTERYGYRSGINQTMRNELKSIVQDACRWVKISKGDNVIDIGANDGTLLSFYPKGIVRVGYEPVKKLAKICKKHAEYVFNEYFNASSYLKIFKKQKKVKIITAIAMFYDLDDPNEFLNDITSLLDEKGIFIIQQNYLLGMLEKNAFDNILHEHIEYYSLYSLENLLKKHNLEVLDVHVNDINGGSFRTYIGFKGIHPIYKKKIDTLRRKEKKIKIHTSESFLKFFKKVNNIKNELIDFIEGEVKKGKKIYVYGASTRGNTILQYCNLDTALIPYAVERNPEKWGKKIASVGIPIISEEQARREKPDYMLVLPWFFKEEFLKREKNYLESGGHFIFPLPQVEII